MSIRHLASMGVLVALVTGCAGGMPLQWDNGDDAEDRLGAIEQRLAEIEQRLDVHSDLQVVQAVDTLQDEVRQLRGASEEQAHRVDSLRSSQRDMYVDLDRRLRALELRPEAGAPASDARPQRGEEEAYQAAFNLMREGRYEPAMAAFEEFLDEYPGGGYAPNARYWLAEAHYVSRGFDDAEREFKRVLADFPDSNKAADARLKLGFIHYEQREWDQARAMLEEVRQKHPDSSAAELAAQRLSRLEQQGH